MTLKGMCYKISFCLQAARETGALQAAKNKLEKQVEELTWRLQLEKRMRVITLYKRRMNFGENKLWPMRVPYDWHDWAL